MTTISTVPTNLNGGRSVSVTADGLFLVALAVGAGPAHQDVPVSAVSKVSDDGRSVTVAGMTNFGGLPPPGSGGDDGLATEAGLNLPEGVTVTRDGGFLVADTGNSVVRKVSATGIVTRVAGTAGTSGFSGDDGYATCCLLAAPNSLAITNNDASFFVCDREACTVRKVAADGIITRIAGKPGVAGASGDGARATSATLNSPGAIAVTNDGGLLIADTGNHIIRKISAAGVISRVAGKPGVSGSSGDDGLATDASLSSPYGVAETTDGGFLIADTGNHAVRAVSPTGIITRVVGILGQPGHGGDGGPPTEAQMTSPISLAVRPDGSYVILGGGVARIVA